MRDGPYLLVVLFLLSVVLSVIFRVAWRTLGRPEHARTWSLGFSVGALGYLLNALGSVPRLTSPGYVFLVSLPPLIVAYLGTRGYRQRAGLPEYGWRFGTAFGLTTVAMLFFNFVVRHEGLRVAVVPLFSGGMLFLAAPAVLRHERRPSTPDRATAWFLAIFGCFEMVLTVLALRIGPHHNVPAIALYNEVLLLGVPSLYVANGLMGMFILTSDLARRMELFAETDALTGLLNRRGFEREAAEAIARARGGRVRLAVVLTDIDHFKRVNDRHGHGVGDVALVRFSSYLRERLPAETIVGRLGGEEFAVLVEGLAEGDVVERAEAVRAGVPGIALGEYEVEPLTASFGISYFEAADTKLGDLLRRADVALYQAKATGRNRVCVFDDSYAPLHVNRGERRALGSGQA